MPFASRLENVLAPAACAAYKKEGRDSRRALPSSVFLFFFNF